MFKTQFDEHKRVNCSTGDPVYILYQGRYDDHGVFDLFESGSENLYDMIQSHRDSVDIYTILDCFSRGDITALSARQGIYIDATGIPSSYSEILNSVIACERAFMALPVDERSKYGHSFSQWLSSLDHSADSSAAADSFIADTSKEVKSDES